METRTRKLAPNYSRQEWRSKPVGNSASLRYTREFILKNYQNLIEPNFSSKDDIQEIILNSPSPPLLTAFFPFAHNLGEEVNSRKHVPREKRPEQIPEWYEEEGPKEIINKPPVSIEICEKPQVKEEQQNDIKVVLTCKQVKNLDNDLQSEDKDLEEKFTKIDLEVEEKLKKNNEEDDYAAPEWDEPTKEEFTFEPIKIPKPQTPIFDVNLLRYHFAVGNPFAQTLLEFALPYNKNFVTYTPGSKPFEKIWFYKDLEGQVHGPFSTLEMFAWTIRDCFPPDLEIAVGSSAYFVPMNIFNTMPHLMEELSQNKRDKNVKDMKTLEEIENYQSQMAGKANMVNVEAKNNAKTNEMATRELKNMLGLFTKK
ncbi:hypothetical protein SteCoe_11247 [Stentor coeruleus]|uniref:GYF domain-containing protein n=1 Tax=Stentor coeruleus TaxID=5963 RepID=A0A1R2CDK8_9CILI|nr:hypothetical protein SteCoe_11247 [Stentor coeruleus]